MEGWEWRWDREDVCINGKYGRGGVGVGVCVQGVENG